MHSSFSATADDEHRNYQNCCSIHVQGFALKLWSRCACIANVFVFVFVSPPFCCLWNGGWLECLIIETILGRQSSNVLSSETMRSCPLCVLSALNGDRQALNGDRLALNCDYRAFNEGVVVPYIISSCLELYHIVISWITSYHHALNDIVVPWIGFAWVEWRPILAPSPPTLNCFVFRAWF